MKQLHISEYAASSLSSSLDRSRWYLLAIISITTGIFTTYGSALLSSGPIGHWTWSIVSIGQLFVSLVFAALASRMPLAGYSYQWISRLASRPGLLPTLYRGANCRESAVSVWEPLSGQ